MDAIPDSQGTKYGLVNTLAISNRKRTIYGCILFQYGPNMLAMSKIVLELRHVTMIFEPTKPKLINDDCKPIWFLKRDCKHISSPLKLRLHSYWVPIFIIIAYSVLFINEIASIFGSCHENYCNHM